MIDIKVKNRIEWISKSGINDFSPTISPAPKSIQRREIESIEQAVHYFLDNEIYHLVVQKKYMGSYCTIYLKKNLEDSYFISRNGFVIKQIDHTQALDAIRDLHTKMLIKYPDFDTILIASELMPWSALGAGLINKEYLAYYDAYNTHNTYLSESDLYTKISKVKSSTEYVEYLTDKKTLSNKEFKAKYKSHIIRQYDALEELVMLDLEKQRDSLAIFKKQIDIFGVDEAISFHPFTILKIVYTNGEEELPNSNLSYADINDDPFLELVFNKENVEENLQQIYNFYDKLTEDNAEGIMIKPAKSYIKGVVPCFKVRNNSYLTMIYGVNFSMDFDYYLHKRNIKRKLEQSIQGWEINQQLLKIPYYDLNPENYYLKLLLLKRIQGEEIEKSLDKRL